jgi:hypothetical protein
MRNLVENGNQLSVIGEQLPVNNDLEQANDLLAQLQQVGRMLNSMIEKSHLFCRQNQNMIRDEQAE